MKIFLFVSFIFWHRKYNFGNVGTTSRPNWHYWIGQKTFNHFYLGQIWARDCCAKFATGLNIIISHSSKSIWVIKAILLPKWFSHWGIHFGKRTASTIHYDSPPRPQRSGFAQPNCIAFNYGLISEKKITLLPKKMCQIT